MGLTSFKDLLVWQKSMHLVKEIYEITDKLPRNEQYGLISQIQRAAVSIPSNIAEGSKRSSRIDYKQFCNVALGSAAEVETQLLIIKSLYNRVNVENSLSDITEIQKMLTSLIKSLKLKPLQTKNYQL